MDKEVFSKSSRVLHDRLANVHSTRPRHEDSDSYSICDSLGFDGVLTLPDAATNTRFEEMLDMAKHDMEVPLDGAVSGAQGTQLADRPTNDHDGHGSRADRIRMRAYELYLERGADPDNALEDWLQAEREFRRAPDEETDTLELRAAQRGLPDEGPPHARL